MVSIDWLNVSNKWHYNPYWLIQFHNRRSRSVWVRTIYPLHKQKKKKNSSTTSGDQIHSTLKVKAIQETNYTLSVFIGSSVWPLFSLINIVIYGMVANKRDIHFCAMPDYVTRMLNNYLTIVIISYRNYDKDSLITIQLRKEFI